KPIVGDFSDVTGYENGTRVLRASEAWERGYTGKNQVVGVADTGLDSGNLATLFSDFKNVQAGYIHGAWSESWEDAMGHGTHVMGSIIADGSGSQGHFKGAAFGAQLVAQSMWSPIIENMSIPQAFAVLF